MSRLFAFVAAVALALSAFAYNQSALAGSADMGVTAAVVHAVAPVAAAPSPLHMPSGATGLALLVLVALSYCVRRFAPSVHWFQTSQGAAVLSTVTALLAALVESVQANGFSLQVVIAALTGAFLSLMATANPTNSAISREAKKMAAAASPPSDPDATPPGGAKAAGWLLPFIAFGAVASLSSCACFSASSAAYNTPQCVVARGVVDCTESTLGAAALAVVRGILGQPVSIDWGEIGQLLGIGTLKDAGCSLAEIEDLFLQKTAELVRADERAAPAAMGAAAHSGVDAGALMQLEKQHAEFTAWRDQWLATKGLKGAEFKLKSGRVVR